jgi:hypothetical protein
MVIRLNKNNLLFICFLSVHSIPLLLLHHIYFLLYSTIYYYYPPLSLLVRDRKRILKNSYTKQKSINMDILLITSYKFLELFSLWVYPKS